MVAQEFFNAFRHLNSFSKEPLRNTIFRIISTTKLWSTVLITGLTYSSLEVAEKRFHMNVRSMYLLLVQVLFSYLCAFIKIIFKRMMLF